MAEISWVAQSDIDAAAEALHKAEEQQQHDVALKEAQLKITLEKLDFQEELLAELAMQVYA